MEPDTPGPTPHFHVADLDDSWMTVPSSAYARRAPPPQTSTRNAHADDGSCMSCMGSGLSLPATVDVQVQVQDEPCGVQLMHLDKVRDVVARLLVCDPRRRARVGAL